jgi:hypothetical protein
MVLRYPNEIAKPYEASIALFQRAFQRIDEPARASALHTVLQHCDAARVYNWPEKQYRQADCDALSETKNAIANMRTVARFYRSFPLQSSPAICAAMLRSGVHLRVKEDPRSIDQGVALGAGQARRLATLLTAAADELENGGLLAKSGPMLHRFRHGPLLFSQPIEGKADAPEAATCLAIVLSFLFRLQDTNGEMTYQMGDLVNVQSGRPQWKLVAQFVDDALGVVKGGMEYANMVGKIIRRNPDLQIVGY